MKKRILSLFITFAMVLTLVPTVAVPASAEELMHKVRLVARGPSDHPSSVEGNHYRSEVIEIKGADTYEATIDFTNSTYGGTPAGVLGLMSFGLATDGFAYTADWTVGWSTSEGYAYADVPDDWNEALLYFDEVKFNGSKEVGTSWAGTLKAPGVRTPDNAAAGKVDAGLWNAYYEPGKKLTGGQPLSTGAFGIGENITSVTVKFRVELEMPEPPPCDVGGVDVRLMAREAEAHVTETNPWKSNVMRIVRDGTYSLAMDIDPRDIPDEPNVAFTSLGEIAIVQQGPGGNVHFGKTSLFDSGLRAPESWHKSKGTDITITYDMVVFNNTEVASLKTSEPQQFVQDGYAWTQDFVRATLWNAWETADQLIATGGSTPFVTKTTGDVPSIGLSTKAPIKRVQVIFTVKGIPFSSTTCSTHDGAALSCTSCITAAAKCSIHTSAALPCATCKPSVVPGRVTAPHDTTRPLVIGDALEVLKYLAKMKSSLDTNPQALEAACITAASKTSKKPAIGDALEILKKLAKMNSPLIP